MSFKGYKRQPVGYHRWFTENPSMRVDAASGRFYRTPAGDFPSVTRFIGETADQGWLDQWIERVGHDEAERIRNEAAAVGNTFHDLNEAWIKEEPGPENPNSEGRALHTKAVPHMRDHYECFLASEEILWSGRLALAGTTDYVARCRTGELAVGDFKNSRKLKNRDDIEDYWIQVCVYAIMWWELTGERPDRLDIMMAVRDDLIVRFYSEPFSDRWIRKAVERIKLFRSQRQHPDRD